MEFETNKLDAMFSWLKSTLPFNSYFPPGNKSLSGEQVEYIKRLMDIEYSDLEGVEFNSDTSKVRKVDLNFNRNNNDGKQH